MASPALTIDHVTKRFATVTAVDDVGFTVGTGELLALLGPNGAGKSTLLRMIVGIFRPDAGHVDDQYHVSVAHLRRAADARLRD